MLKTLDGNLREQHGIQFTPDHDLSAFIAAMLKVSLGHLCPRRISGRDEESAPQESCAAVGADKAAADKVSADKKAAEEAATDCSLERLGLLTALSLLSADKA